MSHAGDANELLEIASDELGSVIGDDSWARSGVELASPLDDHFDIAFGHLFSQFPVDNESRKAIQKRAEIIEGAADVDIAHVDVPMLVGLQGLVEAGAFARRRGVVSPDQSALFHNAVDGGRACSSDV